MSFKCNLNVFRAGGMGGGRRNFRRTDPNSSFRIELRNRHRKLLRWKFEHVIEKFVCLVHAPFGEMSQRTITDH